jgi:hypothetical protein
MIKGESLKARCRIKCISFGKDGRIWLYAIEPQCGKFYAIASTAILKELIDYVRDEIIAELTIKESNSGAIVCAWLTDYQPARKQSRVAQEALAHGW